MEATKEYKYIKNSGGNSRLLVSEMKARLFAPGFSHK